MLVVDAWGDNNLPMAVWYMANGSVSVPLVVHPI